jgi:hypothetical protein
MTATTIGLAGAPWRATVTSWGEVVPWDGSAPLQWWVAADDRWHTPADEPTVRQRRLEGTPVVETTLRVPGGDAVQRVYAVADGGGCTVMEVENRSPLPFAVALSRPDLLTSRSPTDVPADGIALPDGAVVLPVAHRTTLRVALAHDGRGPGRLPADLPAAEQVARGWFAHVDGPVRLVLPEHGEAVVGERCALVLEGPPEDPVGFLLGARELVRLGEPPTPWVDEVAAAVEGLARGMRHRDVPWEADVALVAAGEVLRRAGEARAAGDVAAVRRRLGDVEPRPPQPPIGVSVLAWLESLLAREVPGGAELLPGFPAAWLGQAVEAYRLPVGAAEVSVALRWHGERPALLWDCSTAMSLTCPRLDPTWSASSASGEALLGQPRLVD